MQSDRQVGARYGAPVLQVTFVRRRGRRDHIYVESEDGTTTDWAFPSYGDGLPHDLCHLVVEDELGLTDGFWGLVDRGVVGTRLAELAARWRAIEDRGSIVLTFPSR